METPLTVADVAKHLQLSPSTIYKYTESGKMQSIKIGNRVRIMEGELKNFLQSCKSNTSGGTNK
jgi:excisionase family DNA binding protein